MFNTTKRLATTWPIFFVEWMLHVFFSRIVWNKRKMSYLCKQ